MVEEIVFITRHTQFFVFVKLSHSASAAFKHPPSHEKTSLSCLVVKCTI